MASQENITKFVQNRGDIPLMKRMLAHKSIPHVNVVDTTYHNHTALMYQTLYGTVEAMEFLMARDPPADPNHKMHNHRTIIQTAVDKNDPAKIRLLLEHGADRNLMGYGNCTALEDARNNYPNRTECINVLESYFPKSPRAQKLASEAKEKEDAWMGKEKEAAAGIAKERKDTSIVKYREAVRLAQEKEDARQAVLKDEDKARHFRYSKEDKCLAANLKLVGASSSSSSKGGSASGSQPFRDSSAIIKQGYLQRRKKGVLAFGRWELSYFVLSELSLQYYDAFKNSSPSKPAIDIGNCALSKGGSVFLGGKTCFVISIVAPNNEQFDVACATEAEQVDWMRDLVGRNIKASSNMLYLATLLKINVYVSVISDEYLCRFSFGGTNNSFNISKEWQLNLTYQDMSNMYSSLEKKGLLAGIQWKGFELPSEQQTKSDILYKDKMWHFLERVVKTYPYPPEVERILKLDSELLPYLDSINRSTFFGLRRVADVLVVKVDVPCGNAAEYMYLTSSLIELRNKLRYDQLMPLIKDATSSLNNARVYGLLRLKRVVVISSTNHKVEDLIDSCRYLTRINEAFFEFLVDDPNANFEDTKVSMVAKSSAQLAKLTDELMSMLLQFSAKSGKGEVSFSSAETLIVAIDGWLRRLEGSASFTSFISFAPLYSLEDYMKREKDKEKEQIKGDLSVHMASENPRAMGLSEELFKEFVSTLDILEEFRDQDELSDLNAKIKSAASEKNIEKITELKSQKLLIRIGKKTHILKDLIQLAAELSSKSKQVYGSLVDKDFSDSTADADFAGRCVLTIQYLSELASSLSTGTVGDKAKLRSLLSFRKPSAYKDSALEEPSSKTEGSGSTTNTSDSVKSGGLGNLVGVDKNCSMFPEKVQRLDWKNIRVHSTSNDARLGSGAFSDVYRVRLRIDGYMRDVAVKILRQQQSDDYSKLCEVALNEADIIASSTHRMLDKSGIVTLYGVVMGPLTPELSSLIQVRDGQSRVGIVLSYEPSSLHKVLYPPSRGLKLSLSVAQKLSLVKSLTDALRNLHIAGCVHGDLKPQNILLSGDMNSFQVKLADFNISDLKEVRDLTYGTTIFQQTSHFRGTKGYCAVEQLPDPSNPGAEVTKASRRTDIFSLAVIIWEIFSGKVPHHEIGNNEGALCFKVYSNGRPSQPSVDEIPEMPAALREMLKMCWDADRSRRLTSIECFSIVNHLQNVLMGNKFDIFLSHGWVDKELLSHVYALLTALGFAVWYDKNEMGYDMQKSISDGVDQSKVFLCCFNSTYETRPNCVLELNECKRLYSKKPVVALLLESISGSSWKVTQEMQDKLQLNAKMFCDIHKVASNTAWRDPNTKDCIPPDLMKELKKDLQPLIKILADLKCTPSLK